LQPEERAHAYTIVIASNFASNHLRIGISHAWVKALIYLSFCLILLFIAEAIDYVGLLPKAREHEVLLSENRSLKSRAERLKNDLENNIARIEQFKVIAAKLRTITGDETDPLTPQPWAVDQPRGGSPVRSPASVASLASSSLLDLADKALSDSQKREQEMLSLWDVLSERQNLLISTPIIKPTIGYYSSPFGFRIDPINRRPLLHAGVDIAAPYGTQVLAPADGTVSFAGYENGYGNLVSIDHGYGVITRYGHNSKIFVRTGQKVKRREIISAVGSTGHSTGSHLHYEVIRHGIPVDPLNYILQEN